MMLFKTIDKYDKYILILGLLFSILFVSTIKYMTGSLLDFHGNSDMDIYVPIQMRINDNSLYTKDIYFSEIYQKYPDMLNSFLAYLVKLFINKIIVFGMINYLLFIIFWLSNYFLGKFIFKNSIIGIIFAIISAYGTPVLYGTYWGVYLGIVSLRDFITSITPILILIFLKSINERTKLVFLFFLMGILTNIHLIYAFTLTLIFGITYFFSNRFSNKLIKKVLFLILVYIIGAFPIIVKGFTLSGPLIPSEFIQYRFGGQYILDFVRVVSVFVFPICLFFLGVYIKGQNRFNKKDISIFLLLTSTILLTITFIILTIYSPFISLLQLVRVNKYIFPFLYLYQAFFIYHLINSKKKVFVIGLIIFIVSLIPSSLLISKFVPITYNGFKYDFRLNKVILSDDINKQLTRFYSENSIESLSLWFYVNTNKDTIILMNPFSPATRLRYYSQRNLVISFKDGGIMLLKSKLTSNWYFDMQRISKLYLTNDTDEYISIAKEKNASYIVIENKYNHLDLPSVFINEDFTIYKVSEQ